MSNIIIPLPIKEPFDPSTLKVEVKTATIGQLVEMLKNYLVDLNPDFQRNKDLWGKDKKSQLVESILLGLPLPSFYFYIDSAKKEWVVIDGLQRLCSLKDFAVDDKLKLSNLQFLNEQFGGKKYSDFDYFEQLNFSMHPVTLNVISGEASAIARYLIFQRLNSKGTPLTQAEIRNALYRGKALEMIEGLVESSQFARLRDKGIASKRMNDRDYALRFVAFFVTDYEKNYNGKMDEFLNVILDSLNKTATMEDLRQISDAFYGALNTCFNLLGDDAFRQPVRSIESSDKKNPVSKTLFESTMVTIAHLADEQRALLLANKSAFERNYREMFNDEFLVKSLLNGTGSYKSVCYRFDSMKRMIDKTLEEVMTI